MAEFYNEDRSFGGSGLFVDLIPKTSWFDNARKVLSEKDWQRVRSLVIGRAGGVCEVCGRKPYPKAKIWIEVHERWDYNEATNQQTLRRLIALCSPCHRATHYGLAQLMGMEAKVREHLKKINQWDETDLNRHLQEQFLLWRHRSLINWSVNLDLLGRAGFELITP